MNEFLERREIGRTGRAGEREDAFVRGINYAALGRRRTAARRAHRRPSLRAIRAQYPDAGDAEDVSAGKAVQQRCASVGSLARKTWRQATPGGGL